MTNERTILRKRLNLFLEQKIKVHLVKTDKFFFNGLIFAYFKANDCYVIADRTGDQYVFFEEIADAQAYQEEIR